MQLNLWRFHFRAWRAPWGLIEISLHYTPKYKGEVHKTTVRYFEIEERNIDQRILRSSSGSESFNEDKDSADRVYGGGMEGATSPGSNQRCEGGEG